MVGIVVVVVAVVLCFGNDHSIVRDVVLPPSDVKWKACKV
jgi:hypothetical protein